MNKFAAYTLSAAAAAGFVLAAPSAKAFPDKPIEFVIPFGAGGGADIEGRLLAKEMAKVLGVPVIAVNKPGAGGAITYTYVKNAKPDGHVVAWNSTSILTTTNIGNVPFDYDALDQIGQVEFQPMPLMVKADSRWKTFMAFAAECKANPGKLKLAFAGIGSATHLAALALTGATDCKPTFLPVKANRRNGVVLSGEADAAVATFTSPLNLVKAKKLRYLVITSAKRNPLTPDVPTAMELGLDVDIDLFRGLSVPKGTPESVKNTLADAMIKAANSPAFTAFAAKKGFTIETLRAAAFEKKLAAVDKKVKAIMKKAGLFKSKAK